jgi:hypothetical protein
MLKGVQLAYSYNGLGNTGQAPIDYNRHRVLILPPLLITLLFCFGFISASNHSRNTANQTNKSAGSRQAGMTEPSYLPALKSSAEANHQTTSFSTPATGPVKAAAAPNHLQSALPNNPSPAVTPASTGQPLVNTPVKTVTDKLPL